MQNLEPNEALSIVEENLKQFKKFEPLKVQNFISYEKWQYVDSILLDFPNTEYTENQNALVPNREDGTIQVHSPEYLNRYKFAQLKATIVLLQRQMLKLFFTKNSTRFSILKLQLLTSLLVEVFLKEKDLVYWYSSCGPEDEHFQSLLKAIPLHSCKILADFSRMDICIL